MEVEKLSDMVTLFILLTLLSVAPLIISKEECPLLDPLLNFHDDPASVCNFGDLGCACDFLVLERDENGCAKSYTTKCKDEQTLSPEEKNRFVSTDFDLTDAIDDVLNQFYDNYGDVEGEVNPPDQPPPLNPRHLRRRPQKPLLQQVQKKESEASTRDETAVDIDTEGSQGQIPPAIPPSGGSYGAVDALSVPPDLYGSHGANTGPPQPQGTRVCPNQPAHIDPPAQRPECTWMVLRDENNCVTAFMCQNGNSGLTEDPTTVTPALKLNIGNVHEKQRPFTTRRAQHNREFHPRVVFTRRTPTRTTTITTTTEQPSAPPTTATTTTPTTTSTPLTTTTESTTTTVKATSATTTPSTKTTPELTTTTLRTTTEATTETTITKLTPPPTTTTPTTTSTRSTTTTAIPTTTFTTPATTSSSAAVTRTRFPAPVVQLVPNSHSSGPTPPQRPLDAERTRTRLSADETATELPNFSDLPDIETQYEEYEEYEEGEGEFSERGDVQASGELGGEGGRGREGENDLEGVEDEDYEYLYYYTDEDATPEDGQSRALFPTPPGPIFPPGTRVHRPIHPPAARRPTAAPAPGTEKLLISPKLLGLSDDQLRKGFKAIWSQILQSSSFLTKSKAKQ